MSCEHSVFDDSCVECIRIETEDLRARLEKAEGERDEFKRLGQQFERDSRGHFDQSCLNLQRAEAAEAKLARAREALRAEEEYERKAGPSGNQDLLERARSLRRAALADDPPAPTVPPSNTECDHCCGTQSDHERHCSADPAPSAEPPKLTRVEIEAVLKQAAQNPGRLLTEHEEHSRPHFGWLPPDEVDRRVAQARADALEEAALAVSRAFEEDEDAVAIDVIRALAKKQEKGR